MYWFSRVKGINTYGEAVVRVKLLLFILIMFVLISCTKKAEFVQPPIRTPEFYSNREQKAGLLVAVDPYLNMGKMIHAFGHDVTERGYYAVHLILWNKTANLFDFSQAGVYIINEDNEGFSPLPAKDALESLDVSIAPGKSIGYAFLGAVGLVVTTVCDTDVGLGYCEPDQSEATLNAGKLWQKNVLEPGQRDDGFIFFALGKDSSEFRRRADKQYTFCLENVKITETGETLNFRIRITEKTHGEFQSSLW